MSHKAYDDNCLTETIENYLMGGGAYFEQHTWENGLCALRSLEGHTRC